jgi:hypothetical protein
MRAARIFISYRRDDTAPYALGICQYLQKVFGGKKVFIDVDMSAGANFREVLERRLAKCKVLLALIGPEWANARDQQGQRRLDDPDDWVRVEIASALRRDIPVIPVRVGGAELPKQATLPEDIRRLLDHQAVSVSTASFRNDMSGLARDIRAIPNRLPPKQLALTAGLTAAALVAGSLALYHSGILAVLVAQLTDVYHMQFGKSPELPTPPSPMIPVEGAWDIVMECPNKSNVNEFAAHFSKGRYTRRFVTPQSVKGVTQLAMGFEGPGEVGVKGYVVFGEKDVYEIDARGKLSGSSYMGLGKYGSSPRCNFSATPKD